MHLFFLNFTSCHLRVSKIGSWKNVGLKTSKFILSDRFDLCLIHNFVFLLYKLGRNLVHYIFKKKKCIFQNWNCDISALPILNNILLVELVFLLSCNTLLWAYLPTLISDRQYLIPCPPFTLRSKHEAKVECSPKSSSPIILLSLWFHYSQTIFPLLCSLVRWLWSACCSEAQEAWENHNYSLYVLKCKLSSNKGSWQNTTKYNCDFSTKTGLSG